MKLAKLNKKLKIFILLLILFTVPNQVLAQKVTPKSSQTVNYKLAYINLDWWKKFNDPILDTYLLTAYKNNHDLKIASAKIKQGQQAVKQSLGAEMPQINFAGSFGRTMRSSNLYYGDVLIPEYSQSQFMLPLTMNYEIDIWGKNKLKTKSIKKQLEILKQSERATYISMTTTLSSDYYNLVKIDKMLDYQNKILALQKNILDLTEAKYKSGLAPITDVIYEKKNLTIIEDEKNTLTEDQEVLISQIKTLMDIPEDEILDRISFDKIHLIKCPDKVNSDVISSRPDFIISEDLLKKIGLDIRIAKKELLPSFILTGQVGFNSYEWGKMFQSDSFLSSLGVLPIWNVFTGGQKLAYLRFKKYEYEEATEKYKKTVLNSIQEINDSLVMAKTAEKNYKGSIERLNLENENYRLISQKYSIGGTSNLQKLKTQERFLISEKNEVSNKINCMISTIGLYKAVGGKDITNLNKENL